MCGLFGWNLKADVPTRQHKSMVRLAMSLLVQNDSRGGDSWGVYSVDNDKRLVGLGDSSAMKRGTFELLTHSRSVIGHTRRATTGAIHTRNCHPFRVGSLVGAHNGMVFNHYQLNTWYSRKCEVDSEHIFHHLAEERELLDVQAYGAIAFYDQASEATYCGAFHEGELAIVEIPKIGVVWSSDWRHLERAVRGACWPDDQLSHVSDGELLKLCATDGAYPVGVLEVGEPTWTRSSKSDSLKATGHSASAFDWTEEEKDEIENNPF